jgi:hypothetical protein
MRRVEHKGIFTELAFIFTNKALYTCKIKKMRPIDTPPHF